MAATSDVNYVPRRLRAGVLLLWITLSLAWTIMLLVLFWASYTPADFENLGREAPGSYNTYVTSGQTFSVSRSFCLERDVEAVVRQEFRDGVIYYLPDYFTVFRKGCHNHLVQVKIPAALPAGKYYYRVTIEYQVNPLRKLAVRFPDIELSVGSTLH